MFAFAFWNVHDRSLILAGTAGIKPFYVAHNTDSIRAWSVSSLRVRAIWQGILGRPKLTPRAGSVSERLMVRRRRGPADQSSCRRLVYMAARAETKRENIGLRSRRDTAPSRGRIGAVLQTRARPFGERRTSGVFLSGGLTPLRSRISHKGGR